MALEITIISVMGTAITGLVMVIAWMFVNQRNNSKPRTMNPGVVDLRTTKLGDMSAAWFEEKIDGLVTAMEELTRAVKGKLA